MKSVSKNRVAIIFSGFGNPGQPFLTEWFERISDKTELEIRGFADQAFIKNTKVEILNVGGVVKWWRYMRWRISSIFNSSLKKIPFRQICIVDFKPHIVHVLNAQKYHYYSSVVDYCKSKSVLSFRGFETSVRPKEDPEWKGMLQELYKKADSLHFVSEFLKQEALALGAPMQKCVVLRRTVNTDFFSCQNRDPNSQKEIIALGRLTWQKGYDILLEALSLLMNKGIEFHLTLIGQGPDMEIISNLIQKFELTQRVSLISFLDRDGLKSSFAHATIFVQASLSDALPNSILEASSCGLPIVSTTVGGIPEAVRHGETGFLVPPGDPVQFSSAIENLLCDSNLSSKMGLHAREFMLEEFSHIQEPRKWSDYYLGLI